MDEQTIADIALLVAELNDELDQTNDTGLFIPLILEIAPWNISIQWCGVPLWDSDEDPDQTMADIEAYVRNEMNAVATAVMCWLNKEG